MSLVLDPSLALAWYFEDERSAEADALLDRVVENGALVPSLWRLKIANGFQIAIGRRRIDAAFRDAALARLPPCRSPPMPIPNPMPGLRHCICPTVFG